MDASATADMGPKSEQHLHEEFHAMLTAKKLAIAPSDAQRHAHARTTALVRASLQAGINYDRCGHLAKPPKTR